MTPAAAAIVVNWNGRGIVLAAVRSLLAQDVPLEVVVVDNGSTDGSDGEIEQAFGARVRLLRNGPNLGFGAANNLGIAATTAPWVILLNNDAEAAPGFARELLAAGGRDPRIGMVAARVVEHERRDVIDTVGHLMYWDGLNRGRGRLDVDRGQWDGETEALFPSGAAAAYRRAMLDDIGPFEPSLFLYGDDAELGVRARRAGWSCALAPRAVAYHRYSHSSGRWSTLKAYHVERNRLLLLVRHFPWPLVALSPLFTGWRLGLHAVAAVAGRGAAARLRDDRGSLHLATVTLRAWWGALRLLGRTLRLRRADRVHRRLGSAAFVRLLWRYRLSASEIAFKD